MAKTLPSIPIKTPPSIPIKTPPSIPIKGPSKVRTRPDIDAAVRGGDWSQRMEGEGLPGEANIEQAVYWRKVYTEILAMEEKVVARVRQLMDTQSEAARREVEITNVPVVVAQAERFRQRLGYWEARVLDLSAKVPTKL
jgi:hypothetical protein